MRKPNLIYILADDMGYGDISALNEHCGFKTPNLDEMADVYKRQAESTLLFDQTSFENVIVLGLVQDENGQKMSKSKGNAVDPFEALQEYGADAIRWYFYSRCV